MEKFRNLKAWQKAHELVLEIYKIVKAFPDSEKFILISQILRATISIAANLVEGTKRKSLNDQKHFFNMAETSLEEVKYYLILAKDLQYIDNLKFEAMLSLAQETRRLISGLVNM